MERCNDIVFGDMKYKHRWYKNEQITLFGKKWDIVIAAKAYSGKSITDEQRNSYSYFCGNIEQMCNIIANELQKYINKNFKEFADYWTNAHSINSADELAQVTIPKTLLFEEDGTTIMLLDCVWDEDHGVAVKLIPNIAVGSQDLFL